jgi:chromosome segregation ATPase
METQERTRFEVLLENIQTSVNVIAEGQVALVHRLDRIEHRLDKLEVRCANIEIRLDVIDKRLDQLEVRFDRVERRVDKLDVRFDVLEAKVDHLEVFAGDAQDRLKRIEGHLRLNGPTRSIAPRKRARAAAPKRRPKS